MVCPFLFLGGITGGRNRPSLPFLVDYIKLRLGNGRLSRMVHNGIFFHPKAYGGTSRGGKNDKLVQKREPLDGVPVFR